MEVSVNTADIQSRSAPEPLGDSPLGLWPHVGGHRPKQVEGIVKKKILFLNKELVWP